MSKKIASGISGLDSLLGGGFPEGSLVMVAGGTGTGKSTLALQFLHAGATKLNEPGVLISLEQEPSKIIASAKQYGWDFQDLIDKNKLTIVAPSIYKFESLEENITAAVKKINAKRMVIDSYTIASAFFVKPEERRRGLMLLSRKIQQLGIISLAISDVPEGKEAYSVNGFEEFVVDGVLSLELLADARRNTFTRSIFVRKMRYTEHSLKRVPFKITEKGCVIYPDEVLFE
ncbi:DNA repair and recombination protein RadB [Candidatus Bilamarchaeum dharawalense]|uniref:DNA repair and recombination protein RadB n=1 Tax=Candidatus Bilamarchaeum dharawalense TaxID=2885759 RepID=A0A5E4LLR3_9ARCH|nr:DNA repair and recombination protein RadB [Candidatus Bilamarchaeum dharawalense]